MNMKIIDRRNQAMGGQNDTRRRSQITAIAWHYTAVARKNRAFITSGYVPVVAGETIIPTWQRAVTFFNTSYVFSSELYETSIPKNKPVTAPITGFMRVSFPTAETNNMMITKGTTIPSYQPPGKIIENLIVLPSQLANNPTTASEAVSINLPSKLYATVGVKFTIRDKNIIRENNNKYHFIYDSSFGAYYDGYFTSTPNTTGTYPLIISVYEGAEMVATKTVTVIISNMRTSPIRILEGPGDSITRSGGNGYISETLKNRLGNNVILLGSMGVGSNKWEGRGGWTAAKYRTGDAYSVDGVVNPFYNPVTKDFDFSYYMAQQSFTGVDVVFINLGTNDTFNYKSEESLKAALTNVIANLNYIKNSILAYNSSIKVVFNMTIPPNAYQQKFGEQQLASNDFDQNQWRYKYNNFTWVSEMLKQFDNNILIPVHAGINTETDIADHVHPTLEGYVEIANVQLGYLNSL